MQKRKKTDETQILCKFTLNVTGLITGRETLFSNLYVNAILDPVYTGRKIVSVRAYPWFVI